MATTLGELRRHIGNTAAFTPLERDPTVPPGILAVATRVGSIPMFFVLIGGQKGDGAEIYGRIEQHGRFFHAYDSHDLDGGPRSGIFTSADLALAHLTGAEVNSAGHLGLLAGSAAAAVMDSSLARRITAARGHLG